MSNFNKVLDAIDEMEEEFANGSVINQNPFRDQAILTLLGTGIYHEKVTKQVNDGMVDTKYYIKDKLLLTHLDLVMKMRESNE